MTDQQPETLWPDWPHIQPFAQNMRDQLDMRIHKYGDWEACRQGFEAGKGMSFEQLMGEASFHLIRATACFYFGQYKEARAYLAGAANFSMLADYTTIQHVFHTHKARAKAELEQIQKEIGDSHE